MFSLLIVFVGYRIAGVTGAVWTFFVMLALIGLTSLCPAVVQDAFTVVTIFVGLFGIYYASSIRRWLEKRRGMQDGEQVARIFE
jgi:hypothetical protein